MNACLLHVFHDAANQHVLAVAHGIDVNFDRNIEESIEQHGTVVRHLHGVSHVRAQVIFGENDLHRTATEYIRRPHNQGETHLTRQPHRLVFRTGGRIRRLLQAQLLDQSLEALAILCHVDRIRRSPDDRRTGIFERP